MTMDEFKTKGGVLSGREERYDEFQGVPKNIGGGSSGGFGHVRDGHHEAKLGSEHRHHGDYDNTPNHHSSGLTGSGTTASGLTSSNRSDANLEGNRLGNTGRHVGTDGPIGSTGTTGTTGHHNSTQHGSTGTTGTGKPSLMDKLNPKVDSNGDGKAGFMK